MKKAAFEFPKIPIHISHIGIFAGGNFLFCAPEKTAQLDLLHAAFQSDYDKNRPRTPHITMMIDSSEAVCSALPVLLKSFNPFIGNIARLHL